MSHKMRSNGHMCNLPFALKHTPRHPQTWTVAVSAAAVAPQDASAAPPLFDAHVLLEVHSTADDKLATEGPAEGPATIMTTPFWAYVSLTPSTPGIVFDSNVQLSTVSVQAVPPVVALLALWPHTTNAAEASAAELRSHEEPSNRSRRHEAVELGADATGGQSTSSVAEA